MAIDCLPPELLTTVLARLEYRTELACAECVSHLWHSLIDDALALRNNGLPIGTDPLHRWLPRDNGRRLAYATRLSQMWHARSQISAPTTAADEAYTPLMWLAANTFTSASDRQAADQSGVFRAAIALMYREDTHDSFRNVLVALISALFNRCRTQGFTLPEAFVRRQVSLLIHPVRTGQPQERATVSMEVSLGRTVAHVIKVLLQNHGLYGKAILLPQALRQEDIQTPDDALRAGPMPFQVQLRAETGQPLAHALPRQLYTSQPEECLPRHMFLAEYFDACYSHLPVPLVLEWPDDPLRACPTLRRETWEDLLETGQPLVADGEVMDPFAERYGLRDAVCAMCREPFSHTCTGMIGGATCGARPPGCPDPASCHVCLGRCGHVYHLHCYQQYSAQTARHNCPLCGMRAWEQAYSFARCVSC